MRKRRVLLTNHNDFRNMPQKREWDFISDAPSKKPWVRGSITQLHGTQGREIATDLIHTICDYCGDWKQWRTVSSQFCSYLDSKVCSIKILPQFPRTCAKSLASKLQMLQGVILQDSSGDFLFDAIQLVMGSFPDIAYFDMSAGGSSTRYWLRSCNFSRKSVIKAGPGTTLIHIIYR